jgi:alpha-galactosidase
MGDVWKWGTEVGGNCWRTTGDIVDTWSSMSVIGFKQADLYSYSSPGHWNDPDMLVVGNVGWGPNLHPSRLTADEQYTHISLWCLLSAPLLIGCPIEQIDEFTLNLLTNDEVLEVNQDPLGQQARCVAQTGDTQVWARKLQDGSWAVGLFNLNALNKQKMTANWQDIGLKGRLRVRDLWRQKNMGKYVTSFTTEVPAHGVVLIRVFPE